jgi:hypothetical protein|tara:strand:+ start:1217 stop:1795 length:579 start_codon:yes stop_codon:yes gene_type:complete
MHVAGKVFLGLGVVIMLLGAVMTWSGGSSMDDVGDVDVEGKTVWNGQSGTFYYDDSDEIMVFVKDTVRCDEFSVTIINESGGDAYEADECTSDGSKPSGYEDDPAGWYHMGTFGWDQTRGDFNITASHEIHLLPLWGVLGEEIMEGVGGFLTAAGGVSLVGCGACFALLGGILAAVLNDPKDAMQIQQPPSV